MGSDKIEFNHRPLNLPTIDRPRGSEDEFWIDLMTVGNELRTTIAECAAIEPTITQFDKVSQAVLRGSIVRLFKLFDTYLLLISEHRMEMAMIFARCAYDTAIDLIYWCQEGDQAKVVEFIETSLAVSKKIFEEIEEDERQSRGGNRDVGARIKSSILEDFAAAQRNILDIDSRNWRRSLSVADRAKAVGLGDTYTFLFRSLSRPVHGSWSEFMKYHLVEDHGNYSPNLEFAIPRPQIMSSIPVLVALATQEYVIRNLGDQVMEKRLADIVDWFNSMSQQHEIYLKQ